MHQINSKICHFVPALVFHAVTTPGGLVLYHKQIVVVFEGVATAPEFRHSLCVHGSDALTHTPNQSFYFDNLH